MNVELAFLGATSTVTGSKCRVRAGDESVLVDCGSSQGLRGRRLRNWPPPVKLRDIDGLVLTHAHLDHSGYLPRSHPAGIRWAGALESRPRHLRKIPLPDSGHLQEAELFGDRRSVWRHLQEFAAATTVPFKRPPAHEKA